MTYAAFLEKKAKLQPAVGRDVKPSDVHPFLHSWQAELVAWACKVGRAALWCDTGLGKTVMSIEWARLMGERTLIVAPLAVCAQTVREAAKVGIVAKYVRSDADAVGPGMYVTNYEMLNRFDPAELDAVVLDEASILKNSTGKTRSAMIGHFRSVPYRLACTATPAPNDNEELTNQAEFLGVMPRVEMLAAYFVHDSDTGWRVKGHARRPMFRWMASWAVAVRRPSDLGHDDTGYILPGLKIVQHLLPVDATPDDQLFATTLGGVGGRAKVRRLTLDARCEKAAQIVNDSHKLSGFGDKLSSCPPIASTSASTTPSDANRSSPHLPNGSGATRITEPSTCGTTEPRIRTSSNVMPPSRTPSTPPVASGTPLTPSSERSANRPPSLATATSSETADCGSSSGSAPPSTMNGSLNKEADARFAELLRETPPAASSPSITATPRDASAGSSAASATSGSASSATAPSSSPAPSSTYEGLEPWIVWCGLNDEQDHLRKLFGDRCISISGELSPEVKVERLNAWLRGDRPIMLTKPSILGMGINAQHCARMLFVGLNDSYEAYYQSIRRCYRYGQPRVVEAHIVLSELEGQIAGNVRRKEIQAAESMAALVEEMRIARASVEQ